MNGKILFVAVTATALAFIIYTLKKSDREAYSYSFGFPTHGSIDNRIHGLSYNAFLWADPGNINNPYMRLPYGMPYGMPYDFGYYSENPYFYNNVEPYLNKPCYSSNKNEDCADNYYKVKTVKNKVPHYKCCRYDMY